MKINYLGKFSPSTTSVCEPLQKLTLSKTAWTWNASYQTLYVKAKLLIKEDVCKKFYDETKPLYLETDVSGIGLSATLLQLEMKQYAKGYSTRQHNSEANGICKQKPDQCRIKIQ